MALTRDSNFSTTEVNFLVELIKERKNIIEDKKTDNMTSKSRKRAWYEISEEFRKNGDCNERTVEQSKAKWKGLKQVRNVVQFN